MIKEISKLLTDNKEIISTLIFGFLSVIFAGLSWWYSRLAYLRDNPRIKTFLNKMNIFPSDKEVIFISLVNIGRRPVILKQIHFSCSKSIHGIILSKSELITNISGQLPYTLNEGEEFQIAIDYNLFLGSLDEKRKIIKIFNISDTFGNNYIAKIKYSQFPEISKPNIIQKIGIYINRLLKK